MLGPRLNLVSCAGLAPLVALAARAGLAGLATCHVRASGDPGRQSRVEVPALVAGMVAGADSINDMDLLRRGGMGRLFSGVRAPSTLGIFLRRCQFGRHCAFHDHYLRSVITAPEVWAGG